MPPAGFPNRSKALWFALWGLTLALGLGVKAFGWPRDIAAPGLFLPDWTRSVALYRQPHAVWLIRDTAPGDNLGLLQRVLTLAAKRRQVPELVIYTIPLRDLGQSSEGGFATYADYQADNALNAEAIQAFVQETGLRPRVYLEPDGLSLAVQYRRDTGDSAEARRIYQERVENTRLLVKRYREAGAQVYLDAAHSGWFDYSDAEIQSMAQALNEAGIAEAHGLVSNVSNRQPVTHGPQNERHYLQRLLPRLQNPRLDVVVDTSRNGGVTRPRHYYLAENGTLIDNENPQGRLVGHWRAEGTEILFAPFFGPVKPLSRLMGKEKYQYDASRRILKAPPWLDAVGDVQLGPSPTDTPRIGEIQRFRYIKPPDDCDGSLNCPPGESKSNIWRQTAQLQPQAPLLPRPSVFKETAN